MKRIFILLALIIISLITIISCDRFEKPELIDYNEIVVDFFDEFSTIADTTSAENTEYFLSLFHANYLNSGITKQDMDDFINSIFLVNEPRFLSVELVNNHGYELINNELAVEWKLIITSTNSSSVEELTYSDKILKEGNNYYLFGDQLDPVDEEKLRPFAEILTATWCPTCPSVESAMHDYSELIPDDFFYLEYHIQDEITGEHEFFDNFYGFTSPPVAILQGVETLPGDQSNSYSSILNSYKEMDAELKLSDLVEISNEANYQAEVKIEKLTSEVFDTNNLKLRWAFYEAVSNANNIVGDPCKQVVLTEGYFDITAEDLDSTFAINIDYPRDIPNDMGVVFWLQTANDTHDSDSFIHSWIKQDLGSK